MRVKIDISIGPKRISIPPRMGLAAGPPMSTDRQYSDEPVSNYAEELTRIEKRAFTTYKARIRMAERLVRRGRNWDAALIALATSTTIASISLLSDSMIFGEKGATVLAALAVVSLVLSLVVSNVDYGLRSAKAEANYKALQRIATEAERLKSSFPTESQVQSIREQAAAAVDSSENHSEADYLRYQGADSRSRPIVLDAFTTCAPLVFLTVPAGVALVVAKWFLNV